MLLSTTQQIKKYLAVGVNSSIELLQAAIRVAERRHIVPVLGRAQYEALQALVEAGTEPDGPAAELLELVQEALTNLAYAPHLTVAQLQIDDAGIRITVDENNRPAYQWQMDELRDYLLESGYSALEEVLRFLDENKAEFPDWAASAAYTYNKQLLLNSATDFSRYYGIGESRRTFLALLPIISREEVFVLEPVLSVEFCAALRTEIQTGTLTADTQAVLRLLHPALANFTVAEAMGELSVDFSSQGLVVKELAVGGTNNRTKRQAPGELLAVKREQALGAGREYLRQLLSYLNANASGTRYPEFFASSCYTAPAVAPPPAGSGYPASGAGFSFTQCPPARRGGLYRAG